MRCGISGSYAVPMLEDPRVHPTPTSVDLQWSVVRPGFGAQRQLCARVACDHYSDGVPQSISDRSTPLPSLFDARRCDGLRSCDVRTRLVSLLAGDDHHWSACLLDGDAGQDYVGVCAKTTPKCEDNIYGQGKTQIQPRKCLEPAPEDAASHTPKLGTKTTWVD